MEKNSETLNQEYELDEIERAILNIAEELSKLSRKLEYKSLYHKAKGTLNYSKIDISNAINKLYLKNYIILGSHLTNNGALVNQTRKKIYEYIKSHMGASIREIRKELSITLHLLNWHLAILENFEYIYRVKFLNNINFFPINFDKNYVFVFLILKNEKSFQILKKIINAPLIDFETIIKDFDLPEDVILNHLKSLLEFKLLFAQEIGQKVVYGINYTNIMPIKEYYNLSEEEIQNSFKKQKNIIDEFNSKENN